MHACVPPYPGRWVHENDVLQRGRRGAARRRVLSQRIQRGLKHAEVRRDAHDPQSRDTAVLNHTLEVALQAWQLSSAKRRVRVVHRHEALVHDVDAGWDTAHTGETRHIEL